MPSYCVSLAFAEAGRTEIGVIYAPVTDELFAARRGVGATCNGRPSRVSGCAAVGEAVLGLSYTPKHPRQGFVAALDRVLAAGGEFRRLGSTALGLAYTADGRLDAFWAPRTQSWDCLAGLLLVEEAGGWASDFLAENGALKPGRALGCTPGLQSFLHEACGP
jgi:myo-inositol-1(or 4)-monophosphatase